MLLIATLYAALVSFRPKESESRPRWLFPQRAARWSRISLSVLSGIAVIAFGVWMALGMRQVSRPASRYLVPDGYVGWARVQYDVPGAPPLPVEQGKYVLKFPADGLLKTSSPERFGWAKDEFFYDRDGALRQLRQTASGAGGEIWGRINGERMTPTGKQQYEEFFVGGEQQFRQAVNLKESPRTPANPSK